MTYVIYKWHIKSRVVKTSVTILAHLWINCKVWLTTTTERVRDLIRLNFIWFWLNFCSCPRCRCKSGQKWLTYNHVTTISKVQTNLCFSLAKIQTDNPECFNFYFHVQLVQRQKNGVVSTLITVKVIFSPFGKVN